MTFQPMMRTASCVTAEPVGSYSTFSPLPARKLAVVFCYAHTPRSAFPLGSMASCVARTFLSRDMSFRVSTAIEQPALTMNKIVKIHVIFQ